MSIIQADASIMIVNSPSQPPATQPVQVADTGKVRIGSSCRILPPTAKPAQIADSGRIRMGSSCRILLPSRGRA